MFIYYLLSALYFHDRLTPLSLQNEPEVLEQELSRKRPRTDLSLQKASNTQEVVADELICFGKYIAAELRSFPDPVRHKTKRRIQIAIIKGQDEIHAGAGRSADSKTSSSSEPKKGFLSHFKEDICTPESDDAST